MNITGNKILPRPAVLLALMLAIVVGSGGVSPIFPATGKVVFAALKGEVVNGKVVASNGKAVAGAQVQLLSQKKTLMDVTTTGPDGKFTLDLSVLEDEELAILDTFKIVVSKQGKKTEKGLDQGATSANGVIVVENIELR